MRQAYEDEDNAPMFGDVPLPYPIRTWAEMIEAWEGKPDGSARAAECSAGNQGSRLTHTGGR